MPGSIVRETATLSADQLGPGTLYNIGRGCSLWIGDVNISFTGIVNDNGYSTAEMGFGSKHDFSVGAQTLYLHLGEKVTYPGLGSITLISFGADEAYGNQIITVLVDLVE